MLIGECRHGLFSLFVRALLSVLRALMRVCRALLSVCRALLSEYSCVELECRHAL